MNQNQVPKMLIACILLLVTAVRADDFGFSPPDHPPFPPPRIPWPQPPHSAPGPYEPWPNPPWHHSKASSISATATASSPVHSSTSTTSPSNSTSPFYVGRSVNTTSGLVQGHAAPNASEVSEYLGIPFAQPPVGDLRFAPPVRYYGSSNLSGLYNGNVCPQQALSSFSGSGGSGNISEVPAFLDSLSGAGLERNEDCLTLNVWSKPQSGSQSKPVMVWIYGGGFATGNSNSTAYSGQHLADEQDVVFVNFNYRLGIFGFSGGPTLTQNVGLLDQRMAVEWVRDNAAAFGGDPDRIILFGESAGAASTDYYAYAWLDDPIIAGTIHESGQANSFGNKDPVVQAQRWNDTATSLGCNSTTLSPEDVVTCMRQVPTLNLTNASVGSGYLSLILAQFGPTIDNVTVFSNYTQRDIDGDFIQKPAIVGSNDNEAGIFILIFSFFGINQTQGAYDALTSSVFTCPSLSASYARYLHNVPVWRYRFFPSFPNIQIPTSINRAYHLCDIWFTLGNAVDVSGQNNTLVESQIGKYMRSAWSAFAHDPTGGLSSSPFQWPEFSPDANSTEGLIALGRDNDTTADFVTRGTYDGTCPLFYQGISAT